MCSSKVLDGTLACPGAEDRVHDVSQTTGEAMHTAGDSEIAVGVDGRLPARIALANAGAAGVGPATTSSACTKGFGEVRSSGTWSRKRSETSISPSTPAAVSVAPTATETDTDAILKIGGGQYTSSALASSARTTKVVSAAGVNGWGPGVAAATKPFTGRFGSEASACAAVQAAKRQRTSSDALSSSGVVSGEDSLAPSTSRAAAALIGFGVNPAGGNDSPSFAPQKAGAVGPRDRRHSNVEKGSCGSRAGDSAAGGSVNNTSTCDTFADGYTPPRPPRGGSTTPVSIVGDGGEGGGGGAGGERGGGNTTHPRLTASSGPTASCSGRGGGSRSSLGFNIVQDVWRRRAEGDERVKGTVQAMCPFGEVRDRVEQGDVHLLEKMNSRAVVKRYQRPAAGVHVGAPELLRTPEWLARSVDHITTHCIDKGEQGGGDLAHSLLQECLVEFRRDNPTKYHLAEQDLENSVRHRA